MTETKISESAEAAYHVREDALHFALKHAEGADVDVVLYAATKFHQFLTGVQEAQAMVPSIGASPEPEEDGNLVKHAIFELDAIGEHDEWMRRGVLDLVRTFAAQGHSGFSAAHMVGVLERLLRFQPLSPLTDSPSEWMGVDGGPDMSTTTWQSRRQSEAFSQDGGKTYYLLSECEGSQRPMHTSAPAAETTCLGSSLSRTIGLSPQTTRKDEVAK